MCAVEEIVIREAVEKSTGIWGKEDVDCKKPLNHRIIHLIRINDPPNTELIPRVCNENICNKEQR